MSMAVHYNAYIVTPYADVRREPSPRSCLHYEIDRSQETQCIYGESVVVMQQDARWSYVQIPGQGRYNAEGDIEGYKGWVLSQCLHKKSSQKEKETYVVTTLPWVEVQGEERLVVPFGTILPCIGSGGGRCHVKLPTGVEGIISSEAVMTSQEVHNLTTEEKRRHLIFLAQHFLRSPYFWGGRTAFDAKQEGSTGVDCSSLVNLLYKICGYNVPRDAHDQWRYSSRRNLEGLLPGDIIFSSEREDKGRMTHVMMYCGGGEVVEATEAVHAVRTISLDGWWQEKVSLGVMKGLLEENIFCGAFLL
jgi:gamma-D-glutamyl-L-lysine dipeptidyl-peptidase